VARTLVFDPAEGVRVPFLRGILTRSLQDSGIPFEDAYRVATEVRNALGERKEITTAELRAMVTEQLGTVGPEAAERYANPEVAASSLLLRHRNGTTAPFSRGRHRQSLEVSGLSPEVAASVAAKLYRHLLREGAREIGVRELQRRTHSMLAHDLDGDAAHRYLVWEQFRRSDRTLMLLVGGTTGSGKSTVATQLAHLVEFKRVQNTDMLREVMRVMVPERLVPVLHADSFAAWERLPTTHRSESEEALLIEGYLLQAELLSVACEAAIARAVHERVSLILEGVHVHAPLLARLPRTDETFVVPVMLGVLKPRQLRARLKGRGERVPERPAARYTDHFDAIWRLQSYLLSEADRAGIPIVVNEDRDRAVQQVMQHIIAVLAKSYTATPEEVFRT